MITPIISKIIAALKDVSDEPTVQDALLDAAFLFEKSRGLEPCGWSEEVVQSTPSPQEMSGIRDAVVEFALRTGTGSWTLGKCRDASLKPILKELLRQHLDRDAGELFQAMIALENLGEPFLGC